MTQQPPIAEGLGDMSQLGAPSAPSPETLRADADYVLRHAHETIAPYAAERIRKAAATIERLSAELERVAKELRHEAAHISPAGDNYPANWMRRLSKRIDAALCAQGPSHD